MKNKSLVCISGQENYMDIELFMGLEIIGEAGDVIDSYDEFGKPPSFRDIKIAASDLSRSSASTQSKLSRSMTLLSISYNFIVNELKVNLNDNNLNKMQKQFYRLRDKYGSHSRCVIKLKRKISFLNLENDRTADRILRYNFGQLYNMLPEKYKRIKEVKIDMYSGDAVLKIFVINVKGLAYLEQQHDLKIIKLWEDSLLLLKALKEFMRFREDNMTFDDYLNDWVKKLIGGYNENNTNI